MKDYKGKKEAEQTDVVDDLLKQPVKNLEDRVKQLENEIKDRLNLNIDTLSKLGTQQLFFKERARQLHYTAPFTTKSQFEIETARLEVQKNREMLDCFRDISRLQEQLRESTEELKRERLKLKLTE